MTIMAVAAAVISAASCEKDGDKDSPSVQFSRSLYEIYSQANTDVTIQLSQPSDKDVTIPLTFAGTASMDEDYSVSASSVTIQAGMTSGSVTVTDIAMAEGKEINISIAEVPEGYVSGSRVNAIVAFNSQETLIYSFECESGDLLDRYIVNLTVTGSTSGEEFAFQEKTTVPVSISGDGASLIGAETDGFVFEAGQNKGSIVLNITDPSYSGLAPATVTVNNAESGRYVAGDVASTAVYVKGMLSPATIAGTWEFDSMIDLEELELWFMEMEDDPELLPTHNDGFTLTFAGSEGSYTLTPNDKGDFANYYREADIAYTGPFNQTSGSVTLGKYTSDESQMFTAEVDTPRQQITYFSLSKVNRAFSSETESIGEGAIAMRLRNDGKLEIYIKDYDQPPFGEMWWDGYDPDMFSFAATFTKAE